jgi:hypothetical protein
MSATVTPINLANLDVRVLVDRSGSMIETDTPNRKSRWDYAEESIKSLVTQLGAHDDNGIDIIYFNNQFDLKEGVAADTFADTWKQHNPGGGTRLAPPLAKALEMAAKAMGEKQQLTIVLTDGQPDDQEEVAKTIVAFTKKMDRDEQCAILFARVGQDAKAKAFLEFLDDGLVEKRGAKFDIVDTDDLDVIASKPLQDLVDKAFND